MAISRPILLALVGALLALVAFYSTMGARTSGDEPSEPAGAVERTPAKPQASTRSAPAARRTAKRPAGALTRPGVPADVARALARGRTVVLFFFQRGAADDEATARAVSAVRRRRQAKVVEAPISRLADYRAVIGGAGVSQAPAVVILRGGSAGRSQPGRAGAGVSTRLVEGFVDAESLIQQVADAR